MLAKHNKCAVPKSARHQLRRRRKVPNTQHLGPLQRMYQLHPWSVLGLQHSLGRNRLDSKLPSELGCGIVPPSGSTSVHPKSLLEGPCKCGTLLTVNKHVAVHRHVGEGKPLVHSDWRSSMITSELYSMSLGKVGVAGTTAVGPGLLWYILVYIWMVKN